MQFTEDQYRKPCNCRSVGECSCNTFAWKKALDAMVDSFAEQMKAKLSRKALEGKTGWDDPNWTPDMIKQNLIEHVEKENGDMVDVANIAMFLWNR